MKNTLKNPVNSKYSIIRLIRIMFCVLLLIEVGFTKVQSQTVTDIDGNVYNTVTIGSQVWLKENLKTIKYNDGTAIPNITDINAWGDLTTGAYCDYNNTPANSTTYGRIYNWYVVDNNSATKMASNGGKNVCPLGWHVSSDAEWTTLTTYLGGINVAGGKLKETGTTHWLNNNIGSTNETDFTALPGGVLSLSASKFDGIGIIGNWWSSTEWSTTHAYNWYMVSTSNFAFRSSSSNRYGFSVRCLKDITTDITNPSTSIIEIYPNPVSGILNIDYKSENFETVIILNSQGVLLTKEKAITPRQQLDFSKYSSGLYILEFVKASGEISRVKVINN